MTIVFYRDDSKLSAKRPDKNAVYVDNGFPNRAAYLRSLAEDYPSDAVFLLAELLGPEEDFDGLISHLDDMID